MKICVLEKVPAPTWENVLDAHIELILDFEPRSCNQLWCTSKTLRKLMRVCPTCASKYTCRRLTAESLSFPPQTNGCGCSTLHGITEHQEKQAVLLIRCIPPKERKPQLLWVLSKLLYKHYRAEEVVFSPRPTLQQLWQEQPLQQNDFELFFPILCCTAHRLGELLQHTCTLALTESSKLNDSYILDLCRVFSDRPAHSDLKFFYIRISRGELTEKAFEDPSLWITWTSTAQ